MAEIKYTGSNTLAAMIAAIKALFVKKGEAVTSINGTMPDDMGNIEVPAPTWCGEWNESVVYDTDSLVHYNGSTYIRTSSSAPEGGAPDVDTENWSLFADAGKDGANGKDGVTPVAGVDYFTEAEKVTMLDTLAADLPTDTEFLDNVVEQVKIIKVAESPELVEDIADCTDTSKIYVLPNGNLCAYMTAEVATDTTLVPGFTNLYDEPKGAYAMDGYRYSHSGGAFSAEAATCAIVVPAPSAPRKVNQQYTLRVQGATINGGTTRWTKIYVGNSNDDFTIEASSEATAITEADGTVVFTHTPNSGDNVRTYSWLVFHVDSGVDTSKLIVTIDEEIEYVTAAPAPAYTNLYDESKGAYVQEGKRYSHSGAGFKDQASDCAVVVPIGLAYDTAAHTIRIQGATQVGATYKDNMYFNSSSDFTDTTNVYGGTWSGASATVTESNGQITIIYKPIQSAWVFDWLVFHVAAGVDTSKLIVTLDEEIVDATPTAYDNIVSTLVDTDGSIYNGVGYKTDTRLSSSQGTDSLEGYITFGFIPFEKGDIIRTKGINWISDYGAGYGNYSYVIWYTALGITNSGVVRCINITDGQADTAAFAGVTFTEDEDGVFTIDTTNWNNTYYVDVKYMRICGYGNGDELIITKNQEIKDIPVSGGTEIVTQWMDTGIEYNQPPDYTDRVISLETKTAKLRVDVDNLEKKANTGVVSGNGGSDAFAYAAYPPSPQIPGDGSAEADFNTADIKTSEVYAYMDNLWQKNRTYMIKQNLGKDTSGLYDYYRYVFSKSYWRAWYKEGYPRMYAWQNGSTVIYSVSVSPRVGDTMYTTNYIGTAYSTVTAVDSETIGVPSTRTVNGLVFERYSTGDVEPTIVYTVPLANTSGYKGRTYNSEFAASASIAEFTYDYIVDSNGIKYYRYPFEDKKVDKSRPFSVFVLTNEHGNHGDSMIPCVSLLRMLKDMCSNANIPFLRWLKENAILTVIPVGNPYGSYRNANSVNINRNYDTPGWAGSNTDPQGGTKEDGDFGPYAGSEVETQYIMNTIQQCKPQAALSGHGRGVPTNEVSEYNSCAAYQGCGFDPERMYKVEEALFSMYNFGFGPNGQHLPADVGEDESCLNAGKSPSYIEYAGAVGGLIEIDDHEVGTLDSFTPVAMEQAYAELVLTLQNWCEEALLKTTI